MASETPGLAVPGSAMLPAVYSQRLAVAATSESTNAGLHQPAIVHEAGIRFTLESRTRMP